MAAQSAQQLRQGRCKPCEGGVDKMAREEARQQVSHLAGWALGDGADRIVKTWKHDDFISAIAFVNAVAGVAETEQHHPDIHLVGYNNTRIELMTHAIDGLSENDFILAAKIDAVSETQPAAAPAALDSPATG